MRSSPTVTRVAFSPAPPLDVADGLLGFLAVDVEGLRLDGVALRRTRAGRFDLRYPERRGRGSVPGGAVVRPLTESARQAIERQVFAELERQGVIL
jgi:hypothetical protein